MFRSDCLPYSTDNALICFFQCDDNKVHVLSEAMAKMEEKLSQCPGKLQLDFFSQVNFIGLFIRDQHYDFLMKIADDFSAEIRKSGVYS